MKHAKSVSSGSRRMSEISSVYPNSHPGEMRKLNDKKFLIFLLIIFFYDTTISDVLIF